jgi:HlyD family secretion protein
MLRTWVLAAVVAACYASALHAAGNPASNSIGGTGKIQPRDGVVLITGVPGAVIRSIAVRVGDVVKKGDLLMVLDDRDARSSVDFAQLAAEQASTNAKRSIDDHELVMDRAAERLARAQRQLKVYEDLGPTATSQRQITDLQAAVKEAEYEVQFERSRDSQIRSDAANSVSNATKRLELTKKQLADYRVLAPSGGTVLQVNPHAGERLTGGSAIELGDLTAMYVVCQVFQGDILKLKPGMKATIKSTALDQSLAGTVEQIGRVIDTKAQLGEAKIRLDDPTLPSRLVGMEVEVQIAR